MNTQPNTSPPSRVPVGELTETRPLSNAERYANYLYKRAWTGQPIWFGPARGRNHVQNLS